jgi:hypothetical protein
MVPLATYSVIQMRRDFLAQLQILDEMEISNFAAPNEIVPQLLRA